MSCPATVTLPSVVRGDTWDGFTITGVLLDDEAPASALASALLHFRSAADAAGDPDHVLDTSDPAELVIDDAAAWTLRAPAQILPLAAGRWVFDLEFTDAAGDVHTYVSGVLTVLQDVTR